NAQAADKGKACFPVPGRRQRHAAVSPVSEAMHSFGAALPQTSLQRSGFPCRYPFAEMKHSEPRPNSIGSIIPHVCKQEIRLLPAGYNHSICLSERKTADDSRNTG